MGRKIFTSIFLMKGPCCGSSFGYFAATEVPDDGLMGKLFLLLLFVVLTAQIIPAIFLWCSLIKAAMDLTDR